MKKILLSVFVFSIIMPSFAFATWWNPISWFKKNAKPVEQTSVEIPKNDTPIDIKKKQEEVKNPIQKKSTKEIIKPTVTPTAIIPIATPPVWDACKNIEGVQSLAPTGMYADSGNCFPVVVKTDQQQCEDSFGANSLYTGQKNNNGGNICGCKDNYDWNNTNTACVESNKNQIQALKQEYNNKVSAINQQIIDIKSQYYVDLKNIDESGTWTSRANGLKQKLLTDTNIKIDQLNLQIQQITIDYNNRINQL